MEEQPEIPKILEELSKSNSAKPANRKHSAARKRFALVLGIFLVIVAGVAALGYQQWLLQSRLLQLSKQNQQLSAILVDQDNEIALLRETHDATPAPVPVSVDDTGLRELEAQLTGEITRLRQQLATLQQQQQTASSEINIEWKVQEAEYLLAMANQKLQLEADPTAALDLLMSADAALVASGSNAAFAVRQAIAADQQLLRDIERVNRDEIYLRLDALMSQVESIDLLQSMRENFESRRNNESEAVAVGTSDDGVVAASLEFLGSIFIWRKWDEIPVTMLAPGQDTLIKQNLRLLLEQAQLALLLRDELMFQRSLKNSGDWLRRYSATESGSGKSLLAGIDELLAIDIDPPLPSLDRSLLAISQLTASER